MSPWIETLGVTLLATAGLLLGWWFSRRSGPWWLAGYFIPLLLVIFYGCARQIPRLAFIPPVSWMMTGRTKFAIIGFICTMILTTPAMRLPNRRSRAMLFLLMAVITGLMSVWPFLAPAFNRNFLMGLRTNVDRDGVCRQSSDYNCGPAAAVTALRRLGLPAEEGEIALLAHTTNATGTEPDILADVLQKRYGESGLVSEYRIFKSIQDLQGNLPMLAVIKFNLLTDHFVTVINLTDAEVVVGDPLSGLTVLSHAEFAAKWRFTGITLHRN